MVQRVLAETGFDSAFLELEITESLAMHDQDGVIDKLSRLRALGVRLSIDDFGTGFSSLSYLQRFPVHAIKIDQSFIHQISDATPDSPMVAGIVALARHLGIHVIAEGVEQAVQERFLLGCGCNEMQGFRFSRPLPPHEISALLEAADRAGNGLMEDRLEYFSSGLARPLAEVAGSPASG
jgi:EAL domain-containing protein (putative c-di-GMP-specific phosphodiesterase class I)